MKTTLMMATAAALCLSAFRIPAQGFQSGSDGSMGALDVTVNTNLDLPPDGIFKFTTIKVAQGSTLRFNRNPLNTPVYLLATGDVLINGTIDVSGSQGQNFPPYNGGAGGPGGFDGGNAGGDGHGPGAGRRESSGGAEGAAGVGAYSTQIRGSPIASTNKGITYGSQLLMPLIGGSGGGGSSRGGGGGGGAILIASNTRIDLPNDIASIIASGGSAHSGADGPDGSGGAIRLVAPMVAGSASLRVPGNSYAGHGRVRVDTIDRTGVAFSTDSGPFTLGSFMTVFPPGNPRLDVIQAAGTSIPEGTNAPVSVTLPFGSDPNRTIVVQARNLGADVPIEVVLTPHTGSAIKVQTNINNLVANPATVTVPVTFPINTPVAVNAWIR